ncbi:hypothetical protein [Polynucleobacter sp. UB-Siik-W21]|uniref:hypothetical protein n=1 Tax=Polynucleobacter sp. UB-Siik-W21 TaxID=1855646 RepID=UPI001BFD6C98|nr:hypothetical protein [Polynucleobacter sp. UB-Siik-W21]QWD71341.1 hypothetical protein C2756_05120 [Polynucleobacter sp. UB-Siik-W21]
MDESRISKEELLKQLELDNQSHNQRAEAVSKLCKDWNKANQLLAAKGLPGLTLNEYQDSINYKPDDALVFLAGVDEAWLKDYQERIKQRERASAVYYTSQPKSVWLRIGEFTRIVAIGIFLALFIGFVFLLLY